MNSKKPLVWHVGGEDVRMRIPILQELEKIGFAVAAVGTEESQPFDEAGIKYYRYTLHRGISPLRDAASAKQLTELTKEFQPDIVHAFDTKPALLMPSAARKAKIKGVLRTITGMGYVFSSRSPMALVLKPVYRFMQTQASKYTNITIFQNDDDKEYFERTRLVDSGKSTLVRGSGVDVEHLQSQLPSKNELDSLKESLGLGNGLVIIMVARLVKHKGVLEYIAAAKEIRKTNPDVNFLLVGPQSSEGRQAVSARFLDVNSGVVNWLGPRRDVPALLSLSDVFVLPSYYREGVPRVLLEAGVMGLPLVATDMPGCRDVVKDGVNGFTVPPRNSHALAVAISKLIAKKSMRDEMGAASHSYVTEQFSLSKVVRAYAGLYRKVLGEEYV